MNGEADNLDAFLEQLADERPLKSVKITNGQAAAMIRAARRAVGSDASLKALHTLVLKGDRQVLNGATGKLGRPGPFEVRIIRPDHYVQFSESLGIRYTSGFSGDRLVNAAVPLRPMTFSSQPPAPEEIHVERARFARLMLGLLADTQAAYPLVARSQSVDTLGLSGEHQFAALLDLDPVTRIPVRVRYQGNPRFPKPGSMFPTEPEPAEMTMALDDRRLVDGLNIAHRVTISARDVTFEQITLTDVRVNPPLSVADLTR